MTTTIDTTGAQLEGGEPGLEGFRGAARTSRVLAGTS